MPTNKHAIWIRFSAIYAVFLLILLVAPVVSAAPMSKQETESLFLAVVKRGDLKNAQILVANGANVNAKNQFGNSALYLAAMTGKADLVQFLLKKGARANQPNRNGRSALDAAANLGHAPVVRILLGKGANANAKDINGVTVLMTAVSMEVMARRLAASGYKPEHGQENRGPDPNLTIVKLLLSSGAKVDANSLQFANGEPRIKQLLLLHSKSRPQKKRPSQ